MIGLGMLELPFEATKTPSSRGEGKIESEAWDYFRAWSHFPQPDGGKGPRQRRCDSIGCSGVIRSAGAARVPMGFRSLLVTMTIAAAAAGLSLFAARHDLLVLVVAALAAGVTAGGLYLRNRSRIVLDELVVLREHLEVTRQQAAMLARMTREMRDIVSDQAGNDASGADGRPTIAAMTEIVRDIADNLSDLDHRTDALESEISLLRRDAAMRPTVQTYWQAPPPPAVVAPLAHEQGDARPALREMPPVPDLTSFGEPPRAVRQLVAAAIAAGEPAARWWRSAPFNRRNPDGRRACRASAHLRPQADGPDHPPRPDVRAAQPRCDARG
jgi:hypothetical protein